jgi:hypothetical protein
VKPGGAVAVSGVTIQEIFMPQTPKDDSYAKARKLAEDALGAYAKDDQKKGDQLAEKARDTNFDAVKEVVQELDEDADSDHEEIVASHGPKGEDG